MSNIHAIGIPERISRDNEEADAYRNKSKNILELSDMSFQSIPNTLPILRHIMKFQNPSNKEKILRDSKNFLNVIYNRMGNSTASNFSIITMETRNRSKSIKNSERNYFQPRILCLTKFNQIRG